jgi:formiminotetrahydrofolate cyclodeaminase
MTKPSRRTALLEELPISEFLEETASNSPVPGGGSVAALSAAIAASLVEMVANLTVGRKGFDAVAVEMQHIVERARSCRQRLMLNIDRDAESFARVVVALKLPKATAEERQERNAAVQEAFKEAARIPLEVARDAQIILDLAGAVVEEGNRNAVTDGLVGAMMARTAVLSALYNVRINLDSIRDESFVREVRKEVEAIRAGVLRKEQTILASVDL